MERLSASELGVMLLSLGLLIGLARLLGETARRFQQPAILGELLAGVLLGPTVLGELLPDWQSYLFPMTGNIAVLLDGIGSLAIVLFLLVAGMEVDLSVVWRQGRSALKVGILSTIIPFAVGLSAAWWMPRALGQPDNVDLLIFALFVATAMAISALPVIAKTLMDLDLYRTDLGMTVVSAAIFNDLIGWTLFSVILGMMGRDRTVTDLAMTLILTLLFMATMLTAARALMHRALPLLQAYTHSPGGVLGFAVTCALIGAAATEFIGIHAIFGSFLVGVALGDSSHLQERTRTMIDEFVSFIFAPLFFASIGLHVNFISHFDAALVLLVMVWACFGKIVGGVLGAKWGHLPPRDQWAIGFAMNSRGAMEIILGTLALQYGIIDQRLFVALVTMAIVTSAASGPLIRRALGQRQPSRLFTSLSSKLFLPELAAVTREEAIHELVVAAARYVGLDAAAIEQLIWQREHLAATGIGGGAALPHARLPDIKEPIIVVGLSEAGIAFDSPDGQPAHIVFLLLTPHADPLVQLELSANIAGIFRDPQCLPRVLRAKNFTEFLAVLNTLASKLH